MKALHRSHPWMWRRSCRSRRCLDSSFRLQIAAAAAVDVAVALAFAGAVALVCTAEGSSTARHFAAMEQDSPLS